MCRVNNIILEYHEDLIKKKVEQQNKWKKSQRACQYYRYFDSRYF